MKWTSAVLLATACVGLQGATALAADVELPLRKAGKWEQKTTMNEAGKKHEQTLTICIDGDMERNTAAASGAEHKSNCSKYEVKKDGDKVVIDAMCKMNGRDVESLTEMSGDFQNTFDVKISSTTSGIQDSQSISIKRVIEQQGKYLGESCGDLKAGEAMGTDGTRVMVQ
jgi:hypothetical protein